jgi:hypothetical protein
VIRKLVLHALATAIDGGGDVGDARAALERGDPLLVPFARRALLRAYRQALATLDPSADSGQLLRLAYLRTLDREPSAAVGADAAALDAEYRAARHAHGRAPRLQRWPSVLGALLLMALVLTGALAAYRSLRSVPFQDVSQKPAPPMRGAYADGGVPVPGDPAVARTLSEALPTYLIKLDRWAQARRQGGAQGNVAALEAELAEARQRVLAPDAAQALGEAGTRRLDEMLSRAREAAEGPEESARLLGDRLLEAVGAFDDELAAQGLGWFVDGDLIRGSGGTRLTIIYSFSVEGVSVFEAGPLHVRALSLRRADRLNWSHTLLGFTRPHLRHALVLLDPIERRLANVVGPALADGAVMPLFDQPPVGPDAPEVRARVEQRAGEAARAELVPRGISREAVGRLAEPLAQRAALYRKWQLALEPRRIRLTPPEGLRIPPEAIADLAKVVPRAELAELERIEAALADAALLATYHALRAVLVESVEQHEVQHRLDYARRERLPLPKALEAYVGPMEHDGQERRAASQATAELSAYLAELARDRRTPRVNLALVARFLFDRTLWASAESYVALVIFDGLTRSLATATRGPFLHDGEIDRARVAEAWLELDQRPGDELRRAARTLWQEMFGEELAELRRR